jgi:hypothetical protein
MPPFGVTVPTTVPQRSEIPDELMNYPVLFVFLFVSVIQHSPSLTGPYILMTIYLSDILSTFIASVAIRVSVM